MKIQVTENSVNKKYDLLKKYSKLTLVNIVAIKTIKNIIDSPTDDNFWAIINVEWIYNFIFNPLTNTLKNKIETKFGTIKKNKTMLFKIIV